MEKLIEVRGEDSLTLDQLIECHKVLGVDVLVETPDDFKQSIKEADQLLERIHRIN